MYNFNLTHQIWRQAQPSELSDTVLGRLGFLFTCGVGLRTHKQIHLLLWVETTQVVEKIMIQLQGSFSYHILCRTCGIRLTWMLQKFSLFTLNWNCLKASMKGMLSMSPTVPPSCWHQTGYTNTHVGFAASYITLVHPQREQNVINCIAPIILSELVWCIKIRRTAEGQGKASGFIKLLSIKKQLKSALRIGRMAFRKDVKETKGNIEKADMNEEE